MRTRPHDQLEVYRLAHGLALRVHALSLRLARIEAYEEATQIRRSSKSVAAQIVEGHALRRYKAEYVHYLSRAYGSAEETIEHLRFVLDTRSADAVRAECDDLLEQYDQFTRKLFNYLQAVKTHHDPERASQAVKTDPEP